MGKGEGLEEGREGGRERGGEVDRREMTKRVDSS